MTEREAIIFTIKYNIFVVYAKLNKPLPEMHKETLQMYALAYARLIKKND